MDKEFKCNKNNKISLRTKKLWGKLANDGNNSWLPLYVHMEDSGEVAKLLWDYWLPPHTKKIIVDGIDFSVNKTNDKLDYAKRLAVFMAVSHDLGKASPVFQQKATKIGFGDIIDEITAQGLPVYFKSDPLKKFTHAALSQKILELMGLDRSYAVIVGGHHGKPPNDGCEIDSLAEYSKTTGIGEDSWSLVHEELVQFALNKAQLLELPQGVISLTAQFVLTGFLIMTDWIASGDTFALVSRDWARQIEASEKRAQKAWKQLQLPAFKKFVEICQAENLYKVRFGINTPRPMQISSVQIASEADDLGIMVIEAPMGEGKTEAALAAAEMLACRYGLSGIYFALPTQATSDGIFMRIANWINALQTEEKASIFLAHGKAGFNKDYEGIKIHSNIRKYEELEKGETLAQEAVVVNDWTQGRKKGLLSDFVIGTIDQVLMCGLKQKHLALRHLGIVNKVVIIDECHAYDTYMSSYLDLVLGWLGAYHVPVIILSATLPANRRAVLINAYRESWNKQKSAKRSMLAALREEQRNEDHKQVVLSNFSGEYPLISYTDGVEIKEVAPLRSGRKQKIKINRLNEAELLNTLEKLLEDGGCAGIICNTVQKAQAIAQMLEKKFEAESIKLLHSRFISCDRVSKELEVRTLLGPPDGIRENRPHRLLVVGTQVMEQSLDVDFDVLFTDICPMDLLLQRMGRLHRHKRQKKRPDLLKEATCFVLGIEGDTEFDKGSEAVYEKYLLLKTKCLLKDTVVLPDDIPELVEKAYEENHDTKLLDLFYNGVNNADIDTVYKAAKAKYDKNIAEKKNKARTFQIVKPNSVTKSLVGLLKGDMGQDPSGKRGEATVRDADSSLSVLVVVRKTDDHMYTLPWIPGFADEKITILTDKLAKTIAGCSVTLPTSFSQKWNIDKVIAELENIILDNNLDNWYEYHWLDGELFLVLNEDYEMSLLDKTIKYDKKYGLYIKETEV